MFSSSLLASLSTSLCLSLHTRCLIQPTLSWAVLLLGVLCASSPVAVAKCAFSWSARFVAISIVKDNFPSVLSLSVSVFRLSLSSLSLSLSLSVPSLPCISLNLYLSFSLLLYTLHPASNHLLLTVCSFAPCC